jgi:hypothetical protein
MFQGDLLHKQYALKDSGLATFYIEEIAGWKGTLATRVDRLEMGEKMQKAANERLRVACSQCLWLILMDRVLARLRVKFFFAALRVKG